MKNITRQNITRQLAASGILCIICSPISMAGWLWGKPWGKWP
jgi:hypothetical protein